jgi:hypothetical protein
MLLARSATMMPSMSAAANASVPKTQRHASAEAEQARKIQAKEHSVVVETLAGMFPQLDRDVIDDVVRVKEGR